MLCSKNARKPSRDRGTNNSNYLDEVDVAIKHKRQTNQSLNLLSDMSECELGISPSLKGVVEKSRGKSIRFVCLRDACTTARDL